MRKILMITALAAIFALTVLPVLALQVDVNYDNSADTDTSGSVNVPVIENVSLGDNNDSAGYGPMTLGDKPGLSDYFGLFGGLAVAFLLVMLAVVICVVVFSLINIYHWGMTDKAVFDKVGIKKKKWYIIFFIVPLAATVINVIPILGQILAVVIMIYYTVMIFIYFFSVRKKAV